MLDGFHVICRRSHPVHLSVSVGDGSWRSEENVKKSWTAPLNVIIMIIKTVCKLVRAFSTSLGLSCHVRSLHCGLGVAFLRSKWQSIFMQNYSLILWIFILEDDGFGPWPNFQLILTSLPYTQTHTYVIYSNDTQTHLFEDRGCIYIYIWGRANLSRCAGPIDFFSLLGLS